MTQQKLIISLLLLGAIALSGCNKEQQVSTEATTTTTEGITFSCDQDLDKNTNSYSFTTVAQNSYNRKAIVNWAREDFN